MADGGIGESALLSAALEGAGTGAAIGGGMSLLTGRDPLQGALMGGLSGGLFGGAGSAFADAPAGVDAFTAQTSTGLPTVAADASNSTQALTGLQEPTVYEPTTNLDDYGVRSPYTAGSTSLVGSTGGENVLQNQLGATAGGAPVNPMYTDAAPATGYGAPGSTETISPTTAATGAGATPAATSPGGIGNLVDKAGNFISEHPYMTAGGLGLAYLMNQERNKYGVPAVEKYNGPLSKFNYNPLTYKPDVVMPPTNPYRAQYASGGPVEQMTNENAIGANTGFPQAYMHTSAFASPYQTPISQNVLTGSGDTKVDPYTGEEQSNGGMNQPIGRVNMARGGAIRHYDLGGEIGGAINSIGQGVGDAVHGVGNVLNNGMSGRISMANPDNGDFTSIYDLMNQVKQVQAGRTPGQYNSPSVSANVYQPQYASGGGISSLGSYSDGGRMLKGPGDGMSDDIPAKIGGKQEARLADGEFVVPADVVSHLGNGSTDAGAKQLYAMMDKVRQARTGRKAQGRQIKPNKYMPA